MANKNEHMASKLRFFQLPDFDFEVEDHLLMIKWGGTNVLLVISDLTSVEIPKLFGLRSNLK